MNVMKYLIPTFGCQMNVHDSERLAGILQSWGAVPASNTNQVDIIIIVTCSVRVKAEAKVYSMIGRLLQQKRLHPDMIIGIYGCMAQIHGAKLLKQFPGLDLVMGTRCMHRLRHHLDHIRASGERVCDLDGDHDWTWQQLPAVRHNRVRAWITIMEGCDNYCSYCIVPYARGRERSRSSTSILEEAQTAVQQGAQEIVLLGQNVNSYNRDTFSGIGFVELLRAVDAIPGLQRLRFVTSNPRDFTPQLAEAFADLPTLCEHIHLPVQSGSDSILAQMNRGYTRQQYLQHISNLRQAVPNIALGTDLIVGFPGESDHDFDRTFSLLEMIDFDNLFAFCYSVRPGTVAAELPDDVPDSTKKERLNRLLDFQRQRSLRRNRRLLETTVDVLVEGSAPHGEFVLTGRTRQNHVVNFVSQKECIGHILTVKITDASPNALYGIPDHSESLEANP